MDFIALDFETANAHRNSACEIGLSFVENGKVLRTQSWLIKPPGPFSYWNTKIHGIDAEAVADAPTFGELWEELEPLLDGQVVAAHNASFDTSVLRYCLEHYGLSNPHLSYLCSVSVSRKTWLGLPSYGLASLSALHEIELDHHHAGNDAEACARILLKAARYHLAAQTDDLIETIGMKYGRLFPGGHISPGHQGQKSCSKRGWYKPVV